ncbi:MAG: metallophosphoesterase family protein [Candidatus Krumholzibacteriia bacterium]
MVVGVISDTHGLLRPAAVAALAGCDLIVHAGDIVGAPLLDELRRLAPVHAVRGNCDGAWARALPEEETLDIGGLLVHVRHDLARLTLDPVAAGVAVVISGHSHRPVVARRDGVLYVNPGGAGPRRFALPATVARLTIADGAAGATIVELAGP